MAETIHARSVDPISGLRCTDDGYGNYVCQKWKSYPGKFLEGGRRCALSCRYFHLLYVGNRYGSCLVFCYPPEFWLTRNICCFFSGWSGAGFSALAKMEELSSLSLIIIPAQAIHLQASAIIPAQEIHLQASYKIQVKGNSWFSIAIFLKSGKLFIREYLKIGEKVRGLRLSEQKNLWHAKG